ncbi:MAG: ribosome biogenesis GTPase Der [Bacillota bacterium]|nr:ribosome biogenesis GTPase Der [Bacillota bacterium]
MSTPMVAIVGRPNVGKSTLFNRLVGGRRAIEEKESGVTRDRLYGRANWLDREFLVVDTGGLTLIGREEMELQVQKQAELAIEEAVVIVFLVDGRQGLTPLDEDIAHLLRRQKKPVILVVNKIESKEQPIADFFKLGLSDPLPISASHGLNIGDLLDKIISYFPIQGIKDSEDENLIRVAVVGRPNVGKSSFINALLGEERVIVTNQPGTTRDAIDTIIERNGKKYILVDTAGIRKKSKVYENVEYYSVMRSLRAIDEADVALLLIEATEGVTEQDQKIAGYILENRKALIIALNKWDLVKEQRKEGLVTEIVDDAKKFLKFVSFAPIIFTSVHEPRRLKNLFNLFEEIYKNFCMRISTPVLNNLLTEAQGVNPLPSSKGKSGSIYYWTQASIKPPTFILFVNNASLIHFSYLRYLENRLREAFDFKGVPIKLILRSRKRKGEK